MKDYGSILLDDHEDSDTMGGRPEGSRLFPKNKYDADIAITATCFYNIIGPFEDYQTMREHDVASIACQFEAFRDSVREDYENLVAASERMFHIPAGNVDVEWVESYERVHWVEITNGSRRHFAVPIVKVIGNPEHCDRALNNLIHAFSLENIGDDASDDVHWRTGDIYEYNDSQMRKPELTGHPWHDSGRWYSEVKNYLRDLIDEDSGFECTVQRGQFSGRWRTITKSGGLRTMITPIHVFDIRISPRLPYDEMVEARQTFLSKLQDNPFLIWKLQSGLAGCDQVLIESLSTCIARLPLSERSQNGSYPKGNVRIPVWIEYVGGSSFSRDLKNSHNSDRNNLRYTDVEDPDGFSVFPSPCMIAVDHPTNPVAIEVYRDPWPEHFMIKAWIEVNKVSANDIFYAILRMNWSRCTVDTYPNTKIEPDLAMILRKVSEGIEVLP